MAQDHTARNQAPDEVRELQPFAFTAGGVGDFRPLASTYDEDEVEENTATPKEKSVPESAGSQAVLPTGSESGEDLSEDNPASQTHPTEPDSQNESQTQKSVAPVKPAPSLVAKAKSSKGAESS